MKNLSHTFEQEYPTPVVEGKILSKICDDEEFVSRLVDWADIIRKTFADGGIDEIVSTRRLVHIVNAYKIFGKRMKAIQSCVNRFDDETKESFMSLYEKIDDKVEEVNND